MQLWVSFALYATIGVVFVVLLFGVVNLVRTDKDARSRSNQLMRLRVAVQFVAIILLVILGLVSGAIRR
jgi:predicted cation transporter